MDKQDIMEQSLFKDVKIVTSYGYTVEGKVTVFETVYDNEDDDDGRSEASILIMTKNGEGLGFYESDIQSIEIRC